MYHSAQPNRKSIVTADLEKDERFRKDSEKRANVPGQHYNNNGQADSSECKPKVSSKRKLRLAVSANGNLLRSVSVPDKFLWQGVNEKFKQVSRRGSLPILSQSQHVFGTSSESNQAFMM